MFAKDSIHPGISTLTPNDTFEMALRLMDELKMSYLPVVDNEHLWGLVSESSILEQGIFDESICLFPNLIRKIYVYEDQHIYTVLKFAYCEQVDMVPVIDKDLNYKGVITSDKIIEAATMFSAACEEGGVLMLSMNVNDLYVSEIARLIEENDSKIINLYVVPRKYSSQIDVTIKINKKDLSRIVQTLERYNYNVTILEEEVVFDSSIMEKYNLFMKYLSI